MHVQGDIQVGAHAGRDESKKARQKILIDPMMGDPYRYAASGADIDPIDKDHHDDNQSGDFQGMPQDVYFKYFQFCKLSNRKVS